MSRIEKALEKAEALRKNRTEQLDVAIPEKSSPVSLISFPESDSELVVLNKNLVALTSPDSTVAEEYRKLKSVILKLTKENGFLNTILVTSAVASEGKSLTAINLALTLAQEFDHTVLLVDADFRRPSIDRYLGFKAEAGLSNCLSEGADISEVMINSGKGRMIVLPAGKPINNPVELFSSQRMANILNEIKTRYPDRYVIIDAPPVLPFAEVHHLSHLVDGVLFVVKEHLAKVSDVKAGLEMLKGANIFGLIYNDVISTRQQPSYYYRYKQDSAS